MSPGRAYVFDGTQQDVELQRLRALEQVFDSATRRHLLATGVGAGWNCLEVGAGAGSIATWLADTVGESGSVLAVDINTWFLSQARHPILEVREADIKTATLDPGYFDLVHTRFVLIHVPEWEQAMSAMVRCLKPGGWLVVEEPDFSSSRSLAGSPELRRAFDNVHRAIEAMFRERGMDYAFGARLPELFQERKFKEISIDNDVAIVPGCSPHAEMMGMSTCQLRAKYVATGLATDADIELYKAFTADPACWATYHGTVSAAGRKPSESR